MVQLMLRADAPRAWLVLAAFGMGFPLIAACSQLCRDWRGAQPFDLCDRDVTT